MTPQLVKEYIGAARNAVLKDEQKWCASGTGVATKNRETNIVEDDRRHYIHPKPDMLHVGYFWCLIEELELYDELIQPCHGLHVSIENADIVSPKK